MLSWVAHHYNGVNLFVDADEVPVDVLNSSECGKSVLWIHSLKFDKVKIF